MKSRFLLFFARATLLGWEDVGAAEDVSRSVCGLDLKPKNKRLPCVVVAAVLELGFWSCCS